MTSKKSGKVTQRGGYYTMGYSDREKYESNKKLGDSPWCNASLAMDNIMGQAISSLDRLDPSSGNLDFVKDFYTLFHADKDCICRDIIKEKKSKVTNIDKEFGAGAVGTVYLISRNGVSLIMKEIKKVVFKRYLSLEVYQKPNTRLSHDYFQRNGFGRFKNTVLSVDSDEFSNQTIMHVLLHRILSGTEYSNNYVRQYDAFFCESSGGTVNGYNVMEKADTDLSGFFDKLSGPVTEDNISNILKQIIGPIRALHYFDFRHSDLKCKNVFVQNSSRGVIFKIADYDKSSMTWKGIRFYNGYTGYLGLVAKQVTPEPYFDNDYYWFGAQHVIEYMTRHTHIAFYESYDIYTFIISLLMEPVIYRFFVENETSILRRVWNELWTTQDNLTMLGEIETYQRAGVLKVLRKLGTINSILKMTGVKLKKNVDNVYSLLGINSIDFRGLGKVDLTKELKLSSQNKICLKSCSEYKKEHNGYKSGSGEQIDVNDIIWAKQYEKINACPTNYYKNGSYVYDWDYC